MKSLTQRLTLFVTLASFVLALPAMLFAAPAVPTGLLDAPCAPGSSYLGGDCSAYPLGIGQSVLNATPGSIPFIDSSGQLQQDNANLTWDEANNRLTLSQGLTIGGVNEVLQLTTGVGTPEVATISGNYAYVSGYDGKVAVIDISTPASANVIATVSGLGVGVSPVTISGNNAFVADTNGNASIIDISTPASANVIATVAIGTGPQQPAVSGNYAYVSDVGSSSVSIIDISTPASASVIATVSVGNSPVQPIISGNYAYVSNSSGNSVSIIDISTPALASVIATVGVGSGPRQVTISGNYAYVSNSSGNSVSIIDISTPASANVVNTVGGLSFPRQVTISGNYAYVSNNNDTVSIIDISTPATASVVATVSVGSSPVQPTISGSHAYVSNGGNTVSIIDISTPATASVVATVTVGNTPQPVTVSGNYAYVSNAGFNNLSILDLSEVSSIYAPSDVVALSVEGTIASTILSGSGVVNLSSDNNGNIVPTFSDESLKENVIDISNPLTLINNLKGHYFNWKDADRFGGNREIGFIAQEVEQVIPEVVRDVGGLKSVNYQYLTALNVEGIKALDLRLSDLEALNGLENDSAKNALFSRVREYLGSAVEKVIAGVVRITGRIMQPELCLYDDKGMTCIDRSGLKDILNQANVTATYDGENVNNNETSEDVAIQDEAEVTQETPVVEESQELGQDQTDEEVVFGDALAEDDEQAQDTEKVADEEDIQETDSEPQEDQVVDDSAEATLPEEDPLEDIVTEQEGGDSDAISPEEQSNEQEVVQGVNE